MPQNGTAIDPSTVVCASESQVSSDLAGETVILNVSDGVYYGLDPVGTRIWTLVQEPRTVTDIHHQLLEEYDVTSERCMEDLLHLLAELREHELITLGEN